MLGASMPSPRPFGVVDELNCYFDAPAEPNNVHVEIWLPGHLDPGRLRDAVAAALAAEPRAGVRRARGGWWRRGFTWEFPPRADEDPVATVAWETESDLDKSRERFMAAAPRLDRSPPFRLLLARGPGRDSLILNAHHAAFDGRSCLRLLRLIADRYDATGLPAVPAGAPFQTRIPRSAKTGSPGQAGHPVRRNSRIAPRHADGHRTRRAPGYGFALLGWPGVPAVPAAGAGAPHVTVNDLLIAALIRTVQEWNAAAGRAAGRVLISMPVDAREPGHGDEIGNRSRLCTVTVEPSEPGPLAWAVAAQTGPAKQKPGPAVGAALTAAARVPLPTPVKRRAIRLAVRTVGRRQCDTSLLSNLGVVGEAPCFGALAPERMWFSTTAHMPRGLSVGAITVDGRLQVCLRYRHALFDSAAARDFAALYAAALAGDSP
ncbi:MAG TPA: hypothetical protein VFV73_10215 [Streptosporangiaceae bacterium]|nr:hypothetical protein [Streptosporangiaceae bacterium]